MMTHSKNPWIAGTLKHLHCISEDDLLIQQSLEAALLLDATAASQRPNASQPAQPNQPQPALPPALRSPPPPSPLCESSQGERGATTLRFCILSAVECGNFWYQIGNISIVELFTCMQ